MLELFFKPRMTELGKIKIGGKGKEMTSRSGSTWRAPVKLDHFVITTMHRTHAGDLEADSGLMQQLEAKYGSPLRQIPVQVLSNDIEDIMQAAYVWYGGRTVGARSDGRVVTWFNDPHTGKRLPEPREEPWNDDMLELKDTRNVRLFKLHTVFNCVIASEEARFGGVYKFRTTSVISGRQLYSSLIEVQARTFGVLMGLPLRLVVRPMQVAPEGKPTTVYVVHLELHGPSLQAIQAQALEQMKAFADNRDQIMLAQTQYRRLLAAPGTEASQDEVGDINEEFQPETVEDKANEAPPAEDDPLFGDMENDAVESPEPPPARFEGIQTKREPGAEMIQAAEPKRRGRPLGSKNRPKEPPPVEASTPNPLTDGIEPDEPPAQETPDEKMAREFVESKRAKQFPDERIATMAQALPEGARMAAYKMLGVEE